MAVVELQYVARRYWGDGCVLILAVISSGTAGWPFSLWSVVRILIQESVTRRPRALFTVMLSIMFCCWRYQLNTISTKPQLSYPPPWSLLTPAIVPPRHTWSLAAPLRIITFLSWSLTNFGLNKNIKSKLKVIEQSLSHDFSSRMQLLFINFKWSILVSFLVQSCALFHNLPYHFTSHPIIWLIDCFLALSFEELFYKS